MNKHINIALVAMIALGAFSAQAQTAVTTSVDASVGSTVAPTTASVEAGTTITTPPQPPLGRPIMPLLPGKEGVIPPQKTLPPKLQPGQPGMMRAMMNTNGTTTQPGLPPKPLQPGIGVRAIMIDARASSTAIRKEAFAGVKDARQEMQIQTQALRASTTAARAVVKDEAQKKRLEIAHLKTDFITQRINAAIERVQKLSDRVSVALDQMSAKGVNVTDSRARLVEANARLDEARTKSASVELAIETAFASSTPKVGLQGVQVLVKEVTKTIQEAHRHVAEALSSIKPGLNKPRPATTTVNVSTGASTSTQ
ncbi:MAG: hypothetical protein WAZ40_02550 [Minisyncoccia bacterium]